MMIQRVLFSLIPVLLQTCIEVKSARILALYPFPAKSHFIAFSTLLEELAERGHEMTVVSAHPRIPARANYTDIVIDDHLSESGAEDMNMFEMPQIGKAAEMIFVWKMTFDNCERFFNYPQIQKLIHSSQEFDLILFEVIFTDCVYGFMYKFKAPFIQMISNNVAVWMGNNVGNPNFFSYTPDMLLPYSDCMSFTERLHNTLYQTYITLTRNWIFLPMMESMMRKHFSEPNLPTIHEIEGNTSFLLLNTHVSLNYPRPFTPNTAEVGGLHIRRPKKLPEELQDYLDNAPDGVIYFSLGSAVRGARMPEAKREAFVNAFSQLKQKVLWKWEEDSLPGLPKNVRIEKWLPQNDILAHPNVEIFITHGGLLSTQEATYHGVPLVAIPIMGDQRFNAHHARISGYAIILELHNITTESVLWALTEVLTKPSFAENAQRVSRILRDQPQKPLDQAVFWVEYVLRHNGAFHMRSAALKLNFFQYYLLDIISVILLGITLFLVVSILLCRTLYKFIFYTKLQASREKKYK